LITSLGLHAAQQLSWYDQHAFNVCHSSLYTGDANHIYSLHKLTLSFSLVFTMICIGLHMHIAYSQT